MGGATGPSSVKPSSVNSMRHSKLAVYIATPEDAGLNMHFQAPTREIKIFWKTGIRYDNH